MNRNSTAAVIGIFAAVGIIYIAFILTNEDHTVESEAVKDTSNENVTNPKQNLEQNIIADPRNVESRSVAQADSRPSDLLHSNAAEKDVIIPPTPLEIEVHEKAYGISQARHRSLEWSNRCV